MSPIDRAQRFVDLHRREQLFIMPNPWDPGSAKILESLGFEALGTTSAGFAFSQGKLDLVGIMSLQDALEHAATIVNATNLPVSADLENGYGDSPEQVGETIIAAAAIGLSGCSIEDTTGVKDKPIYDLSLTTERIIAAVEAVNSLEHPFTLTARAENYLHGRRDLDDTLTRLQAFEKAGADVLYAPGLPDIDSIQLVCNSVNKPVNVVAGIGLHGVRVSELENAGVRRISLGSALARAAIGKTIQAATAALHEDSLHHFDEAASFTDIEALIRQSS